MSKQKTTCFRNTTCSYHYQWKRLGHLNTRIIDISAECYLRGNQCTKVELISTTTTSIGTQMWCTDTM